MKYSRIDGVVAWSGGTAVLKAGQSADDNHPLVVERPDLFTDDEPGSSLTSHPGRVESTMQAPGGNRVARQPGRAAGSAQ